MLTPKFVPSSEIVCSMHIKDIGSFMDQWEVYYIYYISYRLYRLATYEHKSLLKTQQLSSMDNN